MMKTLALGPGFFVSGGRVGRVVDVLWNADLPHIRRESS